MPDSEVLLADVALARRIETAEALACAAHAEAARRVRKGATCATLAVGGGLAVYAGGDSPVTSVRSVGMQGGVTPDEIDRIEEFCRQRKVPVRIDLCPHADPSLGTLLASRRYRIAEFNNVLVRRVRADEPEGVPPAGMRFEKVDAGAARTWATLLARGFHDPASEAIVDMLEPFAHVASGFSYLVREGGEAIGCAGGCTVPDLRLALLYGSATLGAHRGRGIQTAFMGLRLGIASRAGCDLAVVCTLPGTVSQRNAERAGFRVAYTKLVMSREW